MELLIIYLIFQIILIIILFFIFLELFQDLILGKVPFVPSTNNIINEIILKIKTEPKIIYDLGAGDARFLIAMNKKYPHAKVIGFEKSLGAYMIGKINIYLQHAKVNLKLRNFFKQNLSDADIVFCYLGSEQMKKLENKFNVELKKNTIVISNTFQLPNWSAKDTYTFSSPQSRPCKVFFYLK